MNIPSVSINTIALVSLVSTLSYAVQEGYRLDYEQELLTKSVSYTSFGGFSEQFTASMQIQFRYNYNQRGSDSITLANSNDNLTLGFTNRRTKLGLKANVTESISARAKLGLSQTSGTDRKSVV